MTPAAGNGRSGGDIALHALTSVGVALLAWRLTSSVTAAGWRAAVCDSPGAHRGGRAHLRAQRTAGRLLCGLARDAVPESPREGRRSSGRVVACGLLFLAGLMSKEHAVSSGRCWC